MKILQIITLSELGGAQTVVVNLANKLIDEGHEVIVAAGEGDGKMWDLLHPSVKKERCENLKRAISPKDEFLTIIKFKQLYKKYRPDIIHLHSSKAGMLGRIAFPTKKIIYTVHGFDSIRLAHRKFLFIERLMQYFCKSIVAVSNYDVHNLLEERINRNVACIHNGIKGIECNSSISFNIPHSYEKIVLCIARLAAPKRSDLYIQMAKLMPNYAFIWIGNQNDVLDKPDNVFFLGNIANAGRYCNLADLFVLPSDFEGLPMVILEAMSAGKPIVASNVGGIKEIVRENINGFVVNNDAESFKLKIDKILQDDELYKKFSEASMKIYNDELTVDKMVNSYLDVYKK